MKPALIAAATLTALPALAVDSWQFKTSIGHDFTHETKRAKVRYGEPDIIQFNAGRAYVRISGRFDDGAMETTEFGRNNVGIALPVVIDGKTTWVGCDPDDEPKGRMNLTERTDTRVSGEFEMTFIKCNDFYSAEPVPFDGVPFTVTGSCSVARTDK